MLSHAQNIWLVVHTQVLAPSGEICWLRFHQHTCLQAKYSNNYAQFYSSQQNAATNNTFPLRKAHIKNKTRILTKIKLIKRPYTLYTVLTIIQRWANIELPPVWDTSWLAELIYDFINRQFLCGMCSKLVTTKYLQTAVRSVIKIMYTQHVLGSTRITPLRRLTRCSLFHQRWRHRRKNPACRQFDDVIQRTPVGMFLFKWRCLWWWRWWAWRWRPHDVIVFVIRGADWQVVHILLI